MSEFERRAIKAIQRSTKRDAFKAFTVNRRWMTVRNRQEKHGYGGRAIILYEKPQSEDHWFDSWLQKRVDGAA